ncbi:class I SAM-dependent methyltransferase [Virgibacillus xinjiangensis]|uniref:Uncharacterized methyltransferase ACFOGI_12850 n=1 Tax=Virgibacillus xinjiangensis TaxID=393090 RepID=A0ABV7CY37_9BACI
MGREFIGIFEDWAEDYDRSVYGGDSQYAAVFHKYEYILREVADRVKGNVLEFGTGTGNLSKKILDAGHEVVGIEPSSSMRKLAARKLPELMVLDGDFLHFPEIHEQIDTIASSYAFHHLTQDEKEKAVRQFWRILAPNGKVVIADTMFVSDGAHEQAIEKARKQGFLELASDLEREYYPLTGQMEELFATNGWQVRLHRMNDFVWLLEAEK